LGEGRNSAQFPCGTPQENPFVVRMKESRRQSAGSAAECAGYKRHLENYTMNSNFTRYTLLQGKGFGGTKRMNRSFGSMEKFIHIAQSKRSEKPSLRFTLVA